MNNTLNRVILIAAILLVSLPSIFSQSIKVACVGNSVTYGMGIENPDERYPAQLQKMLGNEWEIRNSSNSGAT